MTEFELAFDWSLFQIDLMSALIFREDDDVESGNAQTPGVPLFLTPIWARAAHEYCVLMDMVRGTGGVADLAALIVQQLNIFTADIRATMNGQRIFITSLADLETLRYEVIEDKARKVTTQCAQGVTRGRGGLFAMLEPGWYEKHRQGAEEWTLWHTIHISALPRGRPLLACPRSQGLRVRLASPQRWQAHGSACAAENDRAYWDRDARSLRAARGAAQEPRSRVWRSKLALTPPRIPGNSVRVISGLSAVVLSIENRRYSDVGASCTAAGPHPPNPGAGEADCKTGASIPERL
ncbi:hypothetical protein B0H17DRAFT_1201402 [Mycena rosella]|uniref:Uncharacterized protein n=1 Tax=Mycena rosella TaxID=1033263 RepID=A0AAD7DH26_MYCRO|nr:hypothetical protein B0H17DRAFT_1201402 [Mycena rosella]